MDGVLQVVQQFTYQRGFSGSHFPGNYNESFFGFDPIAQGSVGLEVDGIGVKVTRIRRYTKGRFEEPVVAVVHDADPLFRSSRCSRSRCLNVGTDLTSSIGLLRNSGRVKKVTRILLILFALEILRDASQIGKYLTKVANL